MWVTRMWCEGDDSSLESRLLFANLRVALDLHVWGDPLLPAEAGIAVAPPPGDAERVGEPRPDHGPQTRNATA
ncbi:hypothetical protein [Acuticoccus sp. I52.16.1]|uniref:hypothetical protein n=1 Tax=Acuticoccus sp. I52.16.1 TaxID=2928472 RepID=UPI001FD0F9FB|nr:hypothetical protein [Acuticoccus sp. I52.16.1]UOM33729.1 hypothetical protein MRB58_18085 [Acuticoccus sp. I52.16.1]